MLVPVEFLVVELKSLVGWGAHPKRLPLLPTLAGLVDVPDGASFVSAGYIIRRYLVLAIDSLDAREFYGRRITDDKLKRAYRLLLRIEGTGLDAVNRRYRAIQLLGVSHTVDQWRRPFGPEFEFMILLAEHLTNLRQTAA